MVTINLVLIGKILLTLLIFFAIGQIVAFGFGFIMKCFYAFVEQDRYHLRWDAIDVRMSFGVGFIISILMVVLLFVHLGVR